MPYRVEVRSNFGWAEHSLHWTRKSAIDQADLVGGRVVRPNGDVYREIEWYAVLSAGDQPRPPRGPYRSRDEAAQAMHAWAARTEMGGAWLNASMARVAGPFPTRAVARSVDISDYTRYLAK